MRVDQILSVISKYAPDNREITNKSYAVKVHTLLNFDLDFTDFKATTSFIKERYTVKTYKAFITSIIVYLKASEPDSSVIDNYSNLLSTLNEKIQKEYEKNEASPEEKLNTIKRQEIYELIEQFDKKLEITAPVLGNIPYFDRFQMYLVLNLYYLLPPLRNDYVNLEVYDKKGKIDMDTEKNYIFLKDKQLVLNRYKTRKAYGTGNVIDIPDELVEIVSKWIRVRKIIYPSLTQERQLLLTKKLTPMGQVNLTQYLNRIFGRNISSTMLRKSYLSEKYPVVHATSEMKNDAKAMQHSVSTQQTVYRKK
jgi:integrase